MKSRIGTQPYLVFVYECGLVFNRFSTDLSLIFHIIINTDTYTASNYCIKFRMKCLLAFYVYAWFFLRNAYIYSSYFLLAGISRAIYFKNKVKRKGMCARFWRAEKHFRWTSIKNIRIIYLYLKRNYTLNFVYDLGIRLDGW